MDSISFVSDFYPHVLWSDNRMLTQRSLGYTASKPNVFTTIETIDSRKTFLNHCSINSTANTVREPCQSIPTPTAVTLPANTNPLTEITLRVVWTGSPRYWTTALSNGSRSQTARIFCSWWSFSTTITLHFALSATYQQASGLFVV